MQAAIAIFVKYGKLQLSYIKIIFRPDAASHLFTNGCGMLSTSQFWLASCFSHHRQRIHKLGTSERQGVPRQDGHFRPAIGRSRRFPTEGRRGFGHAIIIPAGERRAWHQDGVDASMQGAGQTDHVDGRTHTESS